ncbi:MAG: Fur family transcriptional regulator [Acidimicrobiales bacterium]
MKSAAELTEVFRAQGLKVTPQRLAIFEALQADTGHPTAETVFDRVVGEQPTMSLRTVYQTLNDLVGMGELHQLDLGNGPARFDTTIDAHHHVMCESCGVVADVHADFTAIELPATLADQFSVTTTEVVFRGRCSRCATKTV